MASSSSNLLLLLVLIVVAPSLSTSFLETFATEHPSRPWLILFDEEPEYYKRTYLRHRTLQPWIEADEHRITSTLADTEGFRILSAVLAQQPLSSLVFVDKLYKERNGTKLFIPNCNGINIYVNHLENEAEILEKSPGIIDDLRSGKRQVEKHGRIVERFYGGGNVTVSRPFVYSADGVKEGVAVHGTDGFGTLEFPHIKEKEVENKMKIERLMVANVVPVKYSDCDGDRDSPEWLLMSTVIEGFESSIELCRLEQMPYGITMLYSLYF